MTRDGEMAGWRPRQYVTIMPTLFFPSNHLKLYISMQTHFLQTMLIVRRMQI